MPKKKTIKKTTKKASRKVSHDEECEVPEWVHELVREFKAADKDGCRGKCKKCSCGKTSSGIYCLGLIGALIYYISTASGFWMGVLGVFKALVWPAFFGFRSVEVFGSLSWKFCFFDTIYLKGALIQPDMEQTQLRTHMCGKVTEQEVGNVVALCGWVQSVRDHGGIIFVDLRDYTGLVQVVADPNNLDADLFKNAENLRREDCVNITGKVRMRGEGLENDRLTTGKIEVVLEKLDVLTKSSPPPFEIEDSATPNDDLRLKYRYLDLRRPAVQERLRKRARAALRVRQYLVDEEDFCEVETPFLIRSTPEGARDYVVPSRVNEHKFYALPQSPQLYKQILMVGGFDRYFQFVKCFRDEDLRSDRQPEFTQLDLEMSFVKKADVFRVVENICKQFAAAYGIPEPTEFPKLKYADVIEKYSVDRPDTRFELFTYNVSSFVKDCEFGVFSQTVANAGIVKCINPEKDFSRTELDNYIAFCQTHGAKGMAWVKVRSGAFEGSIAKYIDAETQKALIEHIGAKDDSTIMFIADAEKVCNDVISRLRLRLGDDLDLVDKNAYNFLWVVDFPLFDKVDDGTGWTPSHHMFTMPQEQFVGKSWDDPGEVLAEQYDVVLNGFEIAGGSIRCHRPDVQKQIMEVIGFPEEKAMERFGFLLEAFKYGPPPHGGIAFGFDRVAALMTGTHDIREVIAFPKNKNAQCPMDDSPSTVTEEQLKELHIELRKKKQ